MGQWQKKRVDGSTINNGQQYTTNDQLSLQAVNAIIESGLYTQEFVEKLASNSPSADNNVGTPRVELVDDSNGYKRFAFYNIKGEKGNTGDNGVGISKIEKTSSNANVDTYTITLTNSNTYNFKVTNGTNGVTPTLVTTTGILTNYGDGTPQVQASTIGTKTTFTFYNLKGPQGIPGEPGKQGDTGPEGKQGPKGETGASSTWYVGTAISGDTTSSGKIFSSSGILLAQIGDMYLNFDTSNVYRCLNGGPASNALWVYVANIKGATGQQGPIGSTGPQGPRGVGIKSISVTQIS